MLLKVGWWICNTSQEKRKLCNKSTKSFYQLRNWKFTVTR